VSWEEAGMSRGEAEAFRLALKDVLERQLFYIPSYKSTGAWRGFTILGRGGARSRPIDATSM
jgi:hypothetical protein